jgi:hypothetical protein
VSKSEEKNMKIIQLFVIALALLILGSCTTTKQARKVETSGFLEDIYPMMREGGENEALMVYRSPELNAAFSSVNKVMIDPVMIWGGEQVEAEEDYQHLADRFYAAIHTELSKDYEIVDQAGPGVIRVQAALSNLEKQKGVRKVVSKIMPQTRIVSLIKGLATGKPPAVGEASIEVKVTAAETGELLVASVDRRVGGNKLGKGVSKSWTDVYNILDFWAKGMRFKFCEARSGSDCQLSEK